MEQGGRATAIKTDPALWHSSWQTGCPAYTPPHSVYETAKCAGLAALASNALDCTLNRRFPTW